MVLKPAEQSPLSALRLAELAAGAEIPGGVFDVVPGNGVTVGKAPELHMEVDCLAFIGSTAFGKMFMKYSGQSNLKQVWPETGGNSPKQLFTLNSAVGARQSSGKLLMLNQCLCLESSTMANPFGEAL